MPTITQSNNPSNSITGPGLLMDEFLPIVRYKDPSKQINIPENSELIPIDEKVELDKNLDNDKNKFDILELTTTSKKIKLPFTIKKGGKKSSDDDGIIMVNLSNKNGDTIENGITINKTEFKAEYNSEFTLEIEFTLKESKELYIDFHAKDDVDEEWNIGELKNVHCGRLKIIYEIPNEWEFSKEKINEIKVYAQANNAKYNTIGNENRYHHCTDTHKHIIYKLLDSSSILNFGKDQNHLPSANRITPNDFVKAGEATTAGVRNKLISATYAEPSKTFTVVDINNKDVLNSDGTAGNTDVALSRFKESPIEYIKSKCPDNGYYVFIGAYNDDYHSFTIIVNKEDDNFKFQFIDQMVGVADYTENNFENSKLLQNIRLYKSNFPMQLELYQLRNKKK